MATSTLNAAVKPAEAPNTDSTNPTKNVTTTFQLINPPQPTASAANLPPQRIVTSNSGTSITNSALKAPVIQRIPSNTLPITKTIVTTTTTLGGQATDRMSYKILSQQLPQQPQNSIVSNTAPATQTTQSQHQPPSLTTVVRPTTNQLTAIKSVNAASFLNMSNKPGTAATAYPIVITKTLNVNSNNSNTPVNNSESSADTRNETHPTITAVKRQIITTIKSDSNGNVARSLLGLGASSVQPAPPTTTKSSLTPIANTGNHQASVSDQINPSVSFSSSVNSSITTSSSMQTNQKVPPVTKVYNSNGPHVASFGGSGSLNVTSSSANNMNASSVLNNSSVSSVMPSGGSNSNTRKPCNCTKSMCLKL